MARAIGQQRILNVDLTRRQIRLETIPPADLLHYLGGRGIAAKLLYERTRAGIRPLGPENLMILSAGTLTGTSAPSSGRSSITCKSPATGLYLKVSVGGHFGAELRYAGWDYLVLSGAASSPVLLWIGDDQVEIRDARHLWGRGTRETDDLIRAESGDPQVRTAVIGPAGEKRVLFGCIVCGRYNSASRGGVGAVMGSKNLKAIAVRGHGGLSVAHGPNYNRLASEMRRALALDSGSESLYQWGTSGSIPLLEEMDQLPAHNFTRRTIDHAERLSGQWLLDQGYLKGRESCFGCSTACRRHVRTRTGQWGQVDDAGPELQTVLSLGTGCGITDTEAMLVANRLCNDMGMDTISAGHVVAWAMESYERGILDRESADGLDLRFGNAEAQHALLRRIALREGAFADLLADGSRHASQEMGRDSEQWAMQAKGLEQAAVDTRVSRTAALAFAVNPRGPDHLMTGVRAGVDEAQGASDGPGGEAYGAPAPGDLHSEMVRRREDLYAACDALGICVFASAAASVVNPRSIAQLFSLGLGLPFDEKQLMLGGRRTVTIERCFNVREGARRSDDRLPWRMMSGPTPAAANAGSATDEAVLGELLDQYYALHGWDAATGIPLRSTLEKLGLTDVCGNVAAEG